MEEKTMKTIKFLQWNCKLEFAKYNNGRTAIQLTEVDTEEPIATATVNIPSESLSEGEVIIKDYSENEGMLKALMEAGIVSSPLRYVKSGFVECPVVFLNINPNEL
jgi:hypothetical protein